MLGGRDDDASDEEAPVDGAAPAPEPGAPTSGRRWLRRVGIGLVVVLAAVPVGLQVQAATVRGEAERAEAAQREAERDERAARSRLGSVNSRVQTARSEEGDARGVLDRSREDMRDTGLEEGSLDEVQDQTQAIVDELGDQAAIVAAAIEAQQRLRPAAGTCLFDLLGALNRVSGGHDGETPSDACRAVADAEPGPR